MPESKEPVLEPAPGKLAEPPRFITGGPEARSTAELADMVQAAITDRDHPTLINVATIPVNRAGEQQNFQRAV